MGGGGAGVGVVSKAMLCSRLDLKNFCTGLIRLSKGSVLIPQIEGGLCLTGCHVVGQTQ